MGCCNKEGGCNCMAKKIIKSRKDQPKMHI